MINDVCMLNLCSRYMYFVHKYIGSLVFTPEAIYFLATGKIPQNEQLGFIEGISYLLGKKIGVGRTIDIELKKDINQFKNTDNYIQLLEKLVQEKKGSIKIDKSEIKNIKLPSDNIHYGWKNIRIITDNRTHIFNISYAVRNKRLPELINYLNNHFYIQN